MRFMRLCRAAVLHLSCSFCLSVRPVFQVLDREFVSAATRSQVHGLPDRRDHQVPAAKGARLLQQHQADAVLKSRGPRARCAHGNPRVLRDGRWPRRGPLKGSFSRGPISPQSGPLWALSGSWTFHQIKPMKPYAHRGPRLSPRSFLGPMAPSVRSSQFSNGAQRGPFGSQGNLRFGEHKDNQGTFRRLTQATTAARITLSAEGARPLP